MTKSAIKSQWAEGSVDDHLNIVRATAPSDLPQLALEYDWHAYPEPVLGWVMAQKSIELSTAIAVFQRGDPERFNYLHKRELPAEFQAQARLLDNICLRVNCGFYLPGAGVGAGAGAAGVDLRRMRNWLWAQQDDRAQGQSGRWVLDERHLEALFHDEKAPEEVQTPASPPAAHGLADWARRCLAERALLPRRG